MYYPNMNSNNQTMGIGMGMNMMNMGMQLPGVGNQMMNMGGGYGDIRGVGGADKATTLKKVFIKDIHEEVPDTLVKDILQECGNIIQWKRAKNEKDKPMSFGSVEFDTIEGVLRSLRILNNMNIGGRQLQLKATEKTETFIKEWSQLKQREWEHKAQQAVQDVQYHDFEHYLAADDFKIKERIRSMVQKMDLSKIREDKEKEQEKKEHPRERERLQKKKQIIKDLERKYKDKLAYWEKREAEIEREAQRRDQQGRERERRRDKEKLLEKELEWDSEEDRRKRGSNWKQKQEERNRMRKQEKEEDEEELRKLVKIELPPEPEQIQPPEENEEQEDKNSRLQQARLAAQLLEKQINEKKTKFSFDKQPTSIYEHHPTSTYDQQPNTHLDNQTNKNNNNINNNINNNNNPVVINFEINQQQQQQQTYQNNSIFPTNNIEQEDQQYIQSQKDKQRQEMSAKINQEIEREKIKEKVLQSKQELEKLVKQIPTKKKELFEMKLEWDLLEEQKVLEKKIRPWLVKQSVQILGAEEPDFINIILKKLVQRTDGYAMINKFHEVLAEDTNHFIKKLWRMLIFEQLKIISQQKH